MATRNLPSPQFVENFHQQCKEFKLSGGIELRERLERLPCGLDFILINLEMYCEGREGGETHDLVQQLVERRRDVAERVDEMVPRLEEWTREIEEFNQEPEMTRELARYGQRAFGTPHEMRFYACCLAAISNELRSVSLRTAPMNALNVLADCVAENPGETNKRDLALLLEIGFAAVGVPKDYADDAIDEAIRRARERRRKL